MASHIAADLTITESCGHVLLDLGLLPWRSGRTP